MSISADKVQRYIFIKQISWLSCHLKGNNFAGDVQYYVTMSTFVL